LRQRAEWQPAQLQADVEHGGGDCRRKPPHAIAEHGLQVCSYNGARGCRPKKSLPADTGNQSLFVLAILSTFLNLE
jgi:hypothetical protein